MEVDEEEIPAEQTEEASSSGAVKKRFEVKKVRNCAPRLKRCN